MLHLQHIVQDQHINRHWERTHKFIKNAISERLDTECSAKLKRLYFFLYKELETVIKATPYSLFTNIITPITKYLNTFSKEETAKILEVFAYEKYNIWKAYKLAKDLNIQACTYCNIQYTHTIGDDKNKQGRPQFDHFFPKSKYPYLALSFYNLIPSCSVCNSTLKGDKDMDLETHLHPYIEGSEDKSRITALPQNYEDLVGLESGKDEAMKVYFRLFGDEDFKQKARGNIDLFKLEERYAGHHAYIKELIRLRMQTSDAYLEQLAGMFDIFDGKEEIYRLALRNYPQEKDFHKRPLSKLTRDISEQFGLWREEK